jgi:tetratricopeptide (TPR) repeat protein/O-antigen ligase
MILRQFTDVQRVMVLAAARRPAQAIAGLERVVAPICAIALLLHPSPLTWPALALGALPTAGRWAVTGRPWRSTPFDVALGLFVASVLVGMLVSLDPAGGAVRLTGLAAALILFAWAREHATTPRAAWAATITVLALVTLGALLLVHVAAPFLRLDRVPPLALLANVLEPLGLYRLLVADDAALQRFRLYASGVGALAAVGLSMTVGLGLAAHSRRALVALGIGGLFFGALLLASDNRGSMVAAALAAACLVVWWRPRLLPVAALLVFGTLDLIALGLAQRGFDLRTILERLDFWQKGLLLAAETPLTGVGLGVESVQRTYRAAFEPAYPPFSHAHNIFVQALLEQGVVGLVSLVLLIVAFLRLGVLPPGDGDPRPRAASRAAFGGAVALIVAGLTEIIALTTVGGALLFGLLGLLVAAHDARPTPAAAASLAPAQLPPTGDAVAHAKRARSVLASARRALNRAGSWLLAKLDGLPGRPGWRRVALGTVGLLALAVLALSGLARPIAATPLLNAGTTALYRGTLTEDLSRAERSRALAWAEPPLRLALRVDPESGVVTRNLSLALAARGDREGARRLADDARAHTDPDDRNGLFGVGRAYAAAGALDDAIAVWTEIGAGPQLLRVGRQITESPNWETGITALVSAATVGAPARPAAEEISRAAIAHGESTDAAIRRLAPLVAAGGKVAYFAHLQIARLHRLDGQRVLAAQAVARADEIDRDEQLALERGLQLVWSEQFAEAEAPLRWAAEHPADPPHPVPDGDDPRYWLAFVQVRLGRHAEAAATARVGLAALPAEQASLRAPYHLLLGESLLQSGQPGEALAAFQAGQRLAPADARFADGIARARAAGR